MKKIILNLSLAVFLMSAATIMFGLAKANAAGSSIAVVNMQKVITTSKQGQAANNQLKDLVSKYSGRLLAMRKKIAAIQTELKNSGSIMSASEKTKKTKEFETDISQYSAQQKHIQGVMSEKRFDLLKVIVNKATAIIDSIAKQNGYILVLDAPSVVYRADSIDITNQVLQQMDAK